MNVELTRFRVKERKSHKVDEWMKLLNDHMGEVVLTLQDEKIYVETIFREVVQGEEFLYWYHVQGEGGIDVTESEHAIDQKHLEYWDECIDEDYTPVDLSTEVVMIPEKVRGVMK